MGKDNLTSTAIHSAYIGLPYIDEVKHWSEEDDGECFKDIAEVLVELGCNSRFAITLMHHHFQVCENEIMLSKFENESYLFTTPIESKEARSHMLIPSAWRLFEKNNNYEAVPLEWLIVEESNVLHFTLTEKEKKALVELGEVLKKHDALDRFGFRLSEVAPVTKSGDVVVETTDSKNRKLSLQPESDSDPGLAKAVQTTWQVIEVNHPLQAGFFCKKRTSTYCYTYCKTKCKGNEYYHDEIHKGNYHSESSSTTHYE